MGCSLSKIIHLPPSTKKEPPIDGPDPRFAKINEAWKAAREKTLPVLARRWGARWFIPATVRQVTPTELPVPARKPTEIVLFTRQFDQVWGSFVGMRIMVDQDINWEDHL